MTENSADSATPDGFTNLSDGERRRTSDLPDGSPTGDATEDPDQDSDTDSGGESAEPIKDLS